MRVVTIDRNSLLHCNEGAFAARARYTLTLATLARSHCIIIATLRPASASVCVRPSIHPSVRRADATGAIIGDKIYGGHYEALFGRKIGRGGSGLIRICSNLTSLFLHYSLSITSSSRTTRQKYQGHLVGPRWRDPAPRIPRAAWASSRNLSFDFYSCL